MILGVTVIRFSLTSPVTGFVSIAVYSPEGKLIAIEMVPLASVVRKDVTLLISTVTLVLAKGVPLTSVNVASNLAGDFSTLSKSSLIILSLIVMFSVSVIGA